MFIQCLGRHLAVCSAPELPAVARRDPGFWHLISIMEPSRRLVSGGGLRDVLSLRFDDAENLETAEPGIVFPTAQHLVDAFAFADKRFGEPLLVQCWAGLSRSVAVALGLIARGMFLKSEADFGQSAVETLLEIRPQARPNVLVLRLALESFLPADQAEATAREMVNHPVLLENRFVRC